MPAQILSNLAGVPIESLQVASDRRLQIGGLAQKTLEYAIYGVETETVFCATCRQQLVIKCAHLVFLPPVLRIPVPRNYDSTTTPFTLCGDLDKLERVEIRTAGQQTFSATYKLAAVTFNNDKHHWAAVCMQDRWYHYNDMSENGRLQLTPDHIQFASDQAGMLYYVRL